MAERVFCRSRRASVAVEECHHCLHCDAIQGDPTASVKCTFAVEERHLAADPRAERLEIGALLHEGATVVDQSASASYALRMLRRDDRRSIAVVDGEERLVGLVHETALVSIPRFASSLPTIAARDDTHRPMATALHEATPVRVALRLLASSHLREAIVVCSEGKPLGVFRDVDGLRWLARARGGELDSALGEEGKGEVMDACHARSRILSDHATLRELLRRVASHARTAAGEETARHRLRDVLAELRKKLEQHLTFEDVFLAPLLRDADAWGEVRVDDMTRDHAGQRAILVALTEDAADGSRSITAVAEELDWFASCLERDMREEEEKLLSAAALGEETVAVDQTDG